MLKEVGFIRCKTALNVENKSKFFYASINPYLGCQHQCRYCYVQAEKYSKGNDISCVKVKFNIVDVLIKEISKYIRKTPYGVIYLGTSSDPYQPIEEKYLISHKILSLILNHTSYNIHIFTKSALVLNDIELFKKFKERINISITLITTDERTKEIFEPNSSSILERLECIKRINFEGINCGCSFMPILPYITDSEKNLEDLFLKLKQNRCSYIWWGYLTLRKNITDIKKISQREKYYDILSKNFPELIEKYNFLYKNKFLPEKAYQKIIDKKIIGMAKKYNLPYFGPKWKNSLIQPNQLLFKF
jgi:DNA repair photolyase